MIADRQANQADWVLGQWANHTTESGRTLRGAGGHLGAGDRLLFCSRNE